MCNELTPRNPFREAVGRVSDLKFNAFQGQTVAASSCAGPDLHWELEANDRLTELADEGESAP